MKKTERSCPVDESKASAPTKDLPHPFQTRPEVVAVSLGAPAMFQETAGGPNCALCGAPRDAQIHVEGKAEANDESPNWG
jgi:hypothetical protein